MKLSNTGNAISVISATGLLVWACCITACGPQGGTTYGRGEAPPTQTGNTSCTPGATQQCICPGGQASLRVCGPGGAFGDCQSCPSTGSGTGLCTNTCIWAGDGACDDGGAGAVNAVCDLGTDCADCGARPEPVAGSTSSTGGSTSSGGGTTSVGATSSSGGGSTSGGATSGGSTTSGGTSTGSYSGPPPACPAERVAAVGSLITNIANISYQGTYVAADVKHKLDVDPAEHGCVGFAEFEFELAAPAGCRLTTRWEAGRLTRLELQADSRCPGFRDDVEDTYELAGSGFIWFGGLQSFGQSASTSTCQDRAQFVFPDEDIPLVGASGTRSLTVNLRSLSVHGSIQSQGDTELRCATSTTCLGSRCGAMCLTMESDVANCGACGRDCRMERNTASAVCRSRTCHTLVQAGFTEDCQAACSRTGLACSSAYDNARYAWDESFGLFVYETATCTMAASDFSNPETEWRWTECLCD